MSVEYYKNLIKALKKIQSFVKSVELEFCHTPELDFRQSPCYIEILDVIDSSIALNEIIEMQKEK